MVRALLAIVAVGGLSIADQPPAAALSPDTGTRIDALVAQAKDAMFAGKYDVVADAASAALALAESSGDTPRIGESLYQLARGRHFQSRFTEAVALERRVIALAERAGDTALQARGLNAAGVTLRETGEYEQALESLQRALAIDERNHNTLERSRVLRNIGWLYVELGDMDRAEGTIRAALAAARAVPDKGMELATLEALGLVLLDRGRPREGLEAEQAAAGIAVEINMTAAIDELAANVGRAQMAVGDTQGAIATFQARLASANGSGYTVLSAVMTSGIGEAHLLEHHPAQAVAWLQRARAILAGVDATARLSVAIDIQRSLGRALRDDHRLDEALATFRETLALLDRMREDSLLTESTTASVIASRRDLFTETADLLMDMHRSDEAFVVSERYRARTFLDVLSVSKIDVAQAPSAADDRTRNELLERAARLQNALWRDQRSDENNRQADAQLSEIDEQLERLAGAQRRISPAYALVKHPAIFDADAVQAQLLDDETVLVEYLLGESRSYAWAISRRGILAAVLPSRTAIETGVAGYRRVLSTRPSALTLARAEAEYRTASGAMFDALIAPIEPVLAGARRIIVVADGPLAYMPFETLRPTRAAAVPLVERFDISYAPSASVLGALRARRADAVPLARDIFAMGDPVRGATAHPRDSSPVSRMTATPLPYARAEVTGIGARFPADRRTIYLGADAREDRVKAAPLTEYRYLHFAAHGVLDAVNPARSGLALASGGRQDDDGVLQMREILTLRLNADMVTLSACETGLGRLMNGEGVIGLARAFFYAGAHSVTVSLWNVNDAATATLMRGFYGNLQRGLSRDAALRAAKLRLLHGDRPVWRHPYFWGPFILIGTADERH